MFQSYILRRTKANHQDIDEAEDNQKKNKKSKKNQDN